MLHKIWEKCVNYETVSYLICGFLTTAVDFAVYTVLRHVDIGVGISQALSWMAAVLFAYVVNKLIVFRNYNLRKLGGDRGFIYELFCKFTSSVLNMVLNYVFSKLWIFKNKPE